MNKSMAKIKSRIKLLLSIFLLCNVSSSLYAPSMTFFVTNTNDSGPGSLRQAILNSNANNPAPDPRNIISFAGFNGIITPLSDEPIILQPVLIDGFTAVGASPNTNSMDLPNNAVITVQLEGPGPVFNPFAPLNGLTLGSGSDGSIIRGLSITDFAAVHGFDLSGNPISGSGIRVSSGNNLIAGNFIGMNLLDESAPNFTAIWISGGLNNSIGDGTPAGRNLISGQYGDFGTIHNEGTNTVILGNTIGLDRAGATALMPDARLGLLNLNESGAVIGGVSLLNQRNVIAGFSAANVILNTVANNSLIGNYIGINVSGTAAVQPNGIGVAIYGGLNADQPQNIVVHDNTISGNSYGITVGDDNLNRLPTVATSIFNNIIGLDPTATFVIANQLDGIWVKFAWATQIWNNAISGNGGNGIRLDKSKLTNVKSNIIGTNAGFVNLGNGADGVLLGGQGVGIHSFGDIIGGGTNTGPIPDGNLILFNVNGIESQSSVLFTSIQGNTINSNTNYGILLNQGASFVNIGGFQNSGNLRIVGSLASQRPSLIPPLGTSNIITGNGLGGIRIVDANHNEIQSNMINNNGGNGVSLVDASQNLVGAPDFGNSTVMQPLGNTITNNDGAGVAVIQVSCNAVDNSILSNSIVNNTANGIALVVQ